MRGLYAIVDMDALLARGIPATTFVAALLRARPCALQVRAKRQRPREVLAILRAIAPWCRAAGVPLFANDRPDLARLGGCDGVHVGQRDLAAREVRAAFPGLRVGVSTHAAAELSAAIAAQPDYVAFGPVFPTLSKDRPDPVVGLSGLGEAARVAARAGVPLVAIGGIDLDRAPDVAAIGVAGAVIGALLPEGCAIDGVTRIASALGRALGAP
jgi:thiamine-phosphate pyrophosphorylase